MHMYVCIYTYRERESIILHMIPHVCTSFKWPLNDISTFFGWSMNVVENIWNWELLGTVLLPYCIIKRIDIFTIYFLQLYPQICSLSSHVLLAQKIDLLVSKKTFFVKHVCVCVFVCVCMSVCCCNAKENPWDFVVQCGFLCHSNGWFKATSISKKILPSGLWFPFPSGGVWKAPKTSSAGNLPKQATNRRRRLPRTSVAKQLHRHC